MATRNRAAPAPERAQPAGAGRPRPKATVAQYRALRYWAGNTANRTVRGADHRPYPERAGLPPPLLQQKTVNSLQQHGWWIATPRGWIVLDDGRAACGLPPVSRDVPCPLPDCEAAIGEQCRALREAARPYTFHVHELRMTRARLFGPTVDRGGWGPGGVPADGVRTGGALAGQAPPQLGPERGVTMRDIMRALDYCDPHFAALLRAPRGASRHIGYVFAT